jgi:hypothetical protein
MTFFIPYPAPVTSRATTPPSIGHAGSRGSQLGSPGPAYKKEGIAKKNITNKLIVISQRGILFINEL